jgi:hypothetical protein
MLVQCYQSDFGSGIPAGRGSAKIRRMTKRRLKKYLARNLREIWDASTIANFPNVTKARIAWLLHLR